MLFSFLDPGPCRPPTSSSTSALPAMIIRQLCWQHLQWSGSSSKAFHNFHWDNFWPFWEYFFGEQLTTAVVFGGFLDPHWPCQLIITRTWQPPAAQASGLSVAMVRSPYILSLAVFSAAVNVHPEQRVAVSLTESGLVRRERLTQRVKCETTKGSFQIQIDESSPQGVGRFLDLVRDGFFRDQEPWMVKTCGVDRKYTVLYNIVVFMTFCYEIRAATSAETSMDASNISGHLPCSARLRGAIWDQQPGIMKTEGVGRCNLC